MRYSTNILHDFDKFTINFRRFWINGLNKSAHDLLYMINKSFLHYLKLERYVGYDMHMGCSITFNGFMYFLTKETYFLRASIKYWNFMQLQVVLFITSMILSTFMLYILVPKKFPHCNEKNTLIYLIQFAPYNVNIWEFRE